jgi:putative hydrolase of HD superfamily
VPPLSPGEGGGLIEPAIIDEILDLKALDRAGWLRAGIDHPESVAAHSWGVAWLALVHCPPDLDRHRVMSLAIVHDLAEVRVGDITPHDGVTKAEKKARERVAATALLSGRPDLLSLWTEAAAAETPEACFVKELDRLDMGLQALHYRARTGRDTQEFVDSALREIHRPELRALLSPAANPSADRR